MPTVAELDVQIDATDRASKTLRQIDTLIKSMEGADSSVDVNVDAGSALAELAGLNTTLDAIAGKEYVVDLTIDSAFINATLEDIERDLQRLTEAVEVEVDLDTAAAQAQLEALISRLSSVEDQEIEVDIDTSTANAQIARLRAALQDIPDEKVTIEVNGDRAAVARGRAPPPPRARA